MTADELIAENRKALDQRSELAFDAWLGSTPGYRGFIDVTVDGCPPFVMFSNTDDIIAKAYLYKGANAFEGESLRLWAGLAKTHDVIYDVGAFTGIYALTAAAVHPHAKVLAFEPAANTFHRLVTNVLANGFMDRIGALQMALGDRQQTLELHHPDGIYVLGSGESLLRDHLRRSWYAERVGVVRGDELPKAYAKNPRPFLIALDVAAANLIKIDVEGFETKVLKGFGRLLARNLPTMIIECLGIEPFRSVSSLLGPHGYHSRFIDDLMGGLHTDEERFKARPSNVLFWARDPQAEKLVAAS